jgi:hypothetical protein
MNTRFLRPVSGVEEIEDCTIKKRGGRDLVGTLTGIKSKRDFSDSIKVRSGKF